MAQSARRFLTVTLKETVRNASSAPTRSTALNAARAAVDGGKGGPVDSLARREILVRISRCTHTYTAVL
jgi:hypothetical protein